MEGTRRLRSPRYRPADFNLGTLEAVFSHNGEPPRMSQVIDFSSQGIALAVEAGGGPYLSGDALSLRVHRKSEVFYNGPAVVRHVRDEGAKAVLGLAFQNARMDLGKLYRFDLRLELEERFGTFFGSLELLQDIRPAFKAWVADVRYYLDELRTRLSAEEERTRDLDLLTRQAVERETVDLVSPAVTAFLSERVAELNDIVRDLDDGEHQMHRAYFQHHLNPLFVESPFMARSLRKPLGYAGDYEVMNMLYRDHREGATLFGKVLNTFACGLTAARANINRISFLSARVAALWRKQPDAAVVSVGCGPAREIQEIIDSYPDLEGGTVTLMDIDPLAIRYCERVLLTRLRETGRDLKVQFIRESVRQLVRQEQLDEVLPPQDLVISAGLFDYFSNRMFTHLLRKLYGLLRPGGQLLIGNVSVDNDSRHFMEYMAEWFLHYRSQTDLTALAQCLPPEASYEVEAEDLGVNLFLRVRRPARAMVQPSEEMLAAG